MTIQIQQGEHEGAPQHDAGQPSQYSAEQLVLERAIRAFVRASLRPGESAKEDISATARGLARSTIDGIKQPFSVLRQYADPWGDPDGILVETQHALLCTVRETQKELRRELRMLQRGIRVRSNNLRWRQVVLRVLRLKDDARWLVTHLIAIIIGFGLYVMTFGGGADAPQDLSVRNTPPESPQTLSASNTPPESHAPSDTVAPIQPDPGKDESTPYPVPGRPRPRSSPDAGVSRISDPGVPARMNGPANDGMKLPTVSVERPPPSSIDIVTRPYVPVEEFPKLSREEVRVPVEPSPPIVILYAPDFSAPAHSTHDRLIMNCSVNFKEGTR